MKIQREQCEQRPLVVKLRLVFWGEGRQNRLNSVVCLVPLGGQPFFAVVAHHRQEDVVALRPDGVEGEFRRVGIVPVERK